MPNEKQNLLIHFYTTHKRMPSYAEMMLLFGFKSKNAVYRLVQKFVDAGIIMKDAMGRITPAQGFDEIPMLGSVKAGLPSPTEMVEDTVNLNDLLIRKRDRTYLVTVDGDSMIDAHIADGDMVVAERANTARNGDIVIANIDGECTMKYFKIDPKHPNRAWLEPANKHFKPMHPEHSLEIVAIVRGVVRKY